MTQSGYDKPPPSARTLHIFRAAHLGMCFDVSDAIAPAKGKDRTPPLTDLGELVHNETVLTGRPARGIRIETRVEDVTTPTVMITAWTSAPDWVVDGVEERIDRISRRSLASNEQP